MRRGHGSLILMTPILIKRPDILSKLFQVDHIAGGKSLSCEVGKVQKLSARCGGGSCRP